MPFSIFKLFQRYTFLVFITSSHILTAQIKLNTFNLFNTTMIAPCLVSNNGSIYGIDINGESIFQLSTDSSQINLSLNNESISTLRQSIIDDINKSNQNQYDLNNSSRVSFNNIDAIHLYLIENNSYVIQKMNERIKKGLSAIPETDLREEKIIICSNKGDVFTWTHKEGLRKIKSLEKIYDLIISGTSSNYIYRYPTQDERICYINSELVIDGEHIKLSNKNNDKFCYNDINFQGNIIIGGFGQKDYKRDFFNNTPFFITSQEDLKNGLLQGQTNQINNKIITLFTPYNTSFLLKALKNSKFKKDFVNFKQLPNVSKEILKSFNAKFLKVLPNDRILCLATHNDKIASLQSKKDFFSDSCIHFYILYIYNLKSLTYEILDCFFEDRFTFECCNFYIVQDLKAIYFDLESKYPKIWTPIIGFQALNQFLTYMNWSNVEHTEAIDIFKHYGVHSMSLSPNGNFLFGYVRNYSHINNVSQKSKISHFMVDLSDFWDDIKSQKKLKEKLNELALQE